VCILLSTVIYIAVGYHVFHQRNQLRNLTLSNPTENMSCGDGRESDERVSLPSLPPWSIQLLRVFRLPSICQMQAALGHLQQALGVVHHLQVQRCTMTPSAYVCFPSLCFLPF
jgi:hypothetical protein